MHYHEQTWRQGVSNAPRGAKNRASGAQMQPNAWKKPESLVPSNKAAPRNTRIPRGHTPGDPVAAAVPALRHFATVVVVFLLFCCVPYAHKSMESYRYLDLIDASPLARPCVRC